MSYSSCTLRGGEGCHARKDNTAKNRSSRRFAPPGVRTTIGRGERQYFAVLDRVPSAAHVDLLPSRVRVDAVRYGAAVALIAAGHAVSGAQPGVPLMRNAAGTENAAGATRTGIGSEDVAASANSAAVDSSFTGNAP
jgi:hypothetical protein